MKKLHLLRLKKLADHLQTGKLGHDVFNINVYNENPVPTPIENSPDSDYIPSTEADYHEGCAVMGSAIGECPIVFPAEWVFAKSNDGPLGISYTPVLRDIPNISMNSPIVSAFHFFQIAYPEYEHLFTAHNQAPLKLGGGFLRINAKPQDVAFNLYEFIKKQCYALHYNFDNL